MTISHPSFLYGTAWKEDRTESLTMLALESGFRGIDTANQRKHYAESFVGDALCKAYDSGLVRREDLFLQTKFTYQRGQDHRLPYDPSAPIGTQVHQSFQSSLTHLHTSYLDSYVLHGPWDREGWSRQDREAWEAMEEYARDGCARSLGVSNISYHQLTALLEVCDIAPRFVQNRCYARLGWDVHVREVCDRHGIIYQGFSLLTANRHVLQHPVIRACAARQNATEAQIIFRFSHALGMLPLTGTSSSEHMVQDLKSVDLDLTPDEIRAIERIDFPSTS